MERKVNRPLDFFNLFVPEPTFVKWARGEARPAIRRDGRPRLVLASEHLVVQELLLLLLLLVHVDALVDVGDYIRLLVDIDVRVVRHVRCVTIGSLDEEREPHQAVGVNARNGCAGDIDDDRAAREADDTYVLGDPRRHLLQGDAVTDR